MPKVSVATCTYDRPALLRRAVASLRQQTDQDWEHLIYDDGSVDPEVTFVLNWAAEDPRVRVWRRTTRLDRPSVLWNVLLDRARGRYLTTLDDDDEKLPCFVEAMAGALDHDHTVDVVTCGFLVKKDGEPDWEQHYNLRATPEAIERESLCQGGALLIRREVFREIGPYSETLRTNEDWDWLRRARHKTFKHLPECYMVYHLHDGNRQARAAELGHEADVMRIRSGSTCRDTGLP